MIQERKVEATLAHLYHDAKYDHLKMMKGFAKGILRPVQPADFKDVYLSISQEQGEGLVRLIKENNLRNIIEFGTSFGISTLFLALGAIETDGNIITTELIDLRIGDAMKTLANHSEPIDLLLLDGWKDLYLPVFRMLEPNFHADTYIYVDNADMTETQRFLKEVSRDARYQLKTRYGGEVVVITLRK
jgi:predicted O-methyltransferase YrrM